MEAYDREQLTAEEKSELRRKRRVRNQIISYISLAAAILVLAVCTVFLVRFLNSRANEKEQQRQIEEQLAQMAEEEPKTEEIIEEPVVEYTEEDLLNEVVDSCIQAMPLEDKVAGLFIVTPEAITGVDTAIKAGDGTKEALEKYPVGGMIYFKKNIQSEAQITEMLEKTVTYSKYPLFLAVDEEGGKVARVADALKLTNVGAMAEIGKSGDSNQAYTAMQTVGNYLTKYGFNLDFAPVADILTNADNKAIGDRAFGTEEAVVSAMVPSAVAGLQDTGVTACLKHFPGIGGADADTHEGMASIDRTLEQLRETELKPFIAGIEAGAKMIMVGHITAPEIIGDNTPATFSSAVITDLLRGELGYNGVVITDAMNMAAVTDYYAADEAAVKALRAGADMILMPEDFELAYEGVVKAVQEGVISEDRINDSLARVYRIKYADTVAAE